MQLSVFYSSSSPMLLCKSHQLCLFVCFFIYISVVSFCVSGALVSAFVISVYCVYVPRKKNVHLDKDTL